MVLENAKVRSWRWILFSLFTSKQRQQVISQCDTLEAHRFGLSEPNIALSVLVLIEKADLSHFEFTNTSVCGINRNQHFTLHS